MGRRAGAVTIAIDSWHLDLPDFLELQTETGDTRQKAYDCFPQLVVSDEFMHRVKYDQNWTLVDPYEVEKNLGYNLASMWGEAFEKAYKHIESELDNKIKQYKVVNARDIFKDFMRTALETGLPYLIFKDTINTANPNKDDGTIYCTNLCIESYSNIKPGVYSHTCNLVSLNLANIPDDKLAEACEVSVRLLDNTIEITETPIPESKAHNERYRTIGVGSMGLADWLAYRNLTYKNTQEISDLFEKIAYHCTKASMELAKEIGSSFEAYEYSEWAKGKLVNSYDKDWFRENANAVPVEDWHQLSEDVMNYGIRNSQITAIAPNTSSSLLQGCTASVLPAFGKYISEKWGKGTMPVMPPFIADKFWFYQENKTLNQNTVVDATSMIQRWTDTGISMELVFNLNPGVYFPEEPNRALMANEIYDTLIRAWEKKCKGVYYIRTVKDTEIGKKSDCITCAN